jgi:threonine dehydratase
MSAQHPDYLQKILTAQVYDVAIETPLDPAPNLSARIHNPIFLKREDMQPVFSFKLRGPTTRWPTSARRCSSAG